MNSLRRMLDVLDLFKPEQPVISVEMICNQLNYTPASAYRYVRELSAVGLLVKLPRGYALGPRVIELDRQMTEYDPLLVGSRALADDLVAQTGLDVLVSELYRDTVISVFQKSGSDAQPVSFGRGRPMALFRSATSRVILAYLLPRQLRRLFEAHAGAPDLERLGPTWKDFSRSMLLIRKQGYCLSVGELDPGKSGIAAPIFDEKQRILGSISLVGTNERFQAFNESFLVKLIVDAARQVTARIDSSEG
ncbi:MAG: IclR family transcriptional regulator [Burkholderiaceae bacterium]|nr:IclR family transcriptional regulator [Rhodoferax sp.]